MPGGHSSAVQEILACICMHSKEHCSPVVEHQVAEMGVPPVQLIFLQPLLVHELSVSVFLPADALYPFLRPGPAVAAKWSQTVQAISVCGFHSNRVQSGLMNAAPCALLMRRILHTHP